MEEKIEQLRQEAAQAVKQAVSSLGDLNDIRVKYLGKKGELTSILRGMGQLSKEDRPRIGQIVNEARQQLEQLIAELKAEGLRGIEAIYSTYSPADERQIRSLAEKYDLLLSGGSDFHGSNKPGLDLGTGYGKLFVPEDLLYKIKSERTSAAAANYN